MIFLDGRISGFGKLKDLDLRFQEGLNLIFAPNEGGKSTLQHFLIGLLYGQYRSDLVTQKRPDPWVERYKPWYGREYGGMLRCRLAGGRDLEIRRSFGRDEPRIEIRASTGEDITLQYEQQKNGEVLFAKQHFGMPKELFESVGIIRENRAAEVHGRETIRDRIANLAHSGNEELSIRQSLSRLASMLDSVGSERAPKKPYKQAMDLVRDLEAERKTLLDQRMLFQEWILNRNRLDREARRLDRELAGVRTSLWTARRQDVAARIGSLAGIEKEVAAVRSRIDTMRIREDFPVDHLEELNRSSGAGESILQRLAGVRTGKDAAVPQLAQAELQRRELSAYASMAGNAESEQVTEWFVSYLGQTLQRDGLKKTTDRLLGEAEALEKRLDTVPPALKDPDADWQAFAREAAEEEQSALRSCTGLSESVSREKAVLAESVRAAFNRRLVAVVFVLAAAAPSVMRYLLGSGRIPGGFVYGFGAVCLLVSTWMWIGASKISRKGREAGQRALTLEKELDAVREKGGGRQKRLREVMESSGFQRLEEFLAAAKRSESDRSKLAGIDARLEENRLESRKNLQQAEETYRRLKESLGKVGLSCSPGNLKFQVDLFRANLKRFRELDARYDRCLQAVHSLEAEETALDEEWNRIQTQIRSILDRAGVDNPGQFREECVRWRKKKELLDKEASLAREFGRLAEGRTLEEWRQVLLEMPESEDCQVPDEDAAGKNSIRDGESRAPLLPYLPTIAELEEKERQLAARLSDIRQEHAVSVERVDRAFLNCRQISEIEEDLALAQTKYLELERNRRALGFALDTIENLSRQQQEVLAPQLNAAVEQRFLPLCGHGYREVKIDPDFNVWVRESDTGELRAGEQLSRGTQDQLYFAIRFGILDLLSNEDEPCPCLLDEPFAAYDRPRMLEAYHILVEESARHQLILFTCREDLLEIARQQGAHIVQFR